MTVTFSYRSIDNRTCFNAKSVNNVSRLFPNVKPAQLLHFVCRWSRWCHLWPAVTFSNQIELPAFKTFQQMIWIGPILHISRLTKLHPNSLGEIRSKTISSSFHYKANRGQTFQEASLSKPSPRKEVNITRQSANKVHLDNQMCFPSNLKGGGGR